MPNNNKEEEIKNSTTQKNADSEKAHNISYAQKMRDRIAEVEYIKKGKEEEKTKTPLSGTFRQKSVVKKATDSRSLAKKALPYSRSKGVGFASHLDNLKRYKIKRELKIQNYRKFQKYFNRFEIKYQISLKERDKIISTISPFMKLDPFVQNYFDYEVRSLYFDSNFRHALLEKKDGVGIRRKLRIRYYPDYNRDNRDFAFIEIKKKINENVAKSRVYVELEKALYILDNNHPKAKDFYKNASTQDKNTLKEIWFLYKRYNLKPACIVSYKRQPFLSKVEKTFRLTFDTNVMVRNYNFDLHFGGGSKLIVPRGITIMEVKFNNIIPNWAIKIIQNNDCVQYKISKFAAGLEKTKVLALV